MLAILCLFFTLNPFWAAAQNTNGQVGPVSISSLRLKDFFDCLRKYHDFKTDIVYKTGRTGIIVNLSFDELGTRTNDAVQDCYRPNEFGLLQMDYIMFVGNVSGNFTPIAAANTDSTIIFSMITDAQLPIGEEWRGNGVMGNSTENTLTRRANNNTVIKSIKSAWQDQVTCDTVTNACNSRCKATGSISMSTSTTGIHHATAWSRHQCQKKGRDDYKGQTEVNHSNTQYWVYSYENYWLYSGAMSPGILGDYWNDCSD